MSTELYDHGLERAVLNCIADESALDVTAARVLLEQARLVPADFHLPLHAEVFATATALLRDGHPVDVLAIGARLPKVKHEKLVEALMGAMSVPQSLPAHAQALRNLALRRRAVTVSEAVRAAALNHDKSIDTVLTTGAAGWADLTKVTDADRGGQEVFLSALDILERTSRGEQVRCLETGIDVWDEVLGGLTVGELTFLGSQPGVGKSSVIGTMLDNLCGRGVACALFSLEDKSEWLPTRLLSRAAAVPLFVMQKKPLTSEQMRRIDESSQAVFERLKPLRVDDRSMLTVEQLVQAARGMVLQHQVKVVVIDHLGKMAHDFRQFPGRPDLAIEHTLNHLTALAKDSGVAVLVAAHLKGREADARFKRPEPTDFAQTAFIERDARAAVGLYFDKEDPDVLLAAVLKQTNGNGNDVFPIGRLKESALVKSRNGSVARGLPYQADEQRMLSARDRATGDRS